MTNTEQLATLTRVVARLESETEILKLQLLSLTHDLQRERDARLSEALRQREYARYNQAQQKVTQEPQQQTMQDRVFYAATALNGMLAYAGNRHPQEAARLAFAYADAMIHEANRSTSPAA